MQIYEKGVGPNDVLIIYNAQNKLLFSFGAPPFAPNVSYVLVGLPRYRRMKKDITTIQS